MATYDTLIRNVWVFDGSGEDARKADVAIESGRIAGIGELTGCSAERIFEGQGKALSPGFIDSHTHDDLYAIRCPKMLPKLSQGVTTVIVGNCGICAAPVTAESVLPEPMNLLGSPQEFRFSTFQAYKRAVEEARPAVNVAALVGHTALRANHMDRMDRVASPRELAAMRVQLQEALDHGAIGLSTGLAYLSAFSASTEEVMALAEPLFAAGGLYATHMRTEGDAILTAMDEAFAIGRHAQSRVVISHLKCAGVDNWGRSEEVLHRLESARTEQDVGCDCYPYSASSTTLDLRQVDPRVKTTITWSEPHPQVAGKTLQEIASAWEVSLLDAAARLRPAGAIYHSMSEDDMRTILSHAATMIGSDGLPNDPHPHPRLWGTFPRVLGRYSRDEKLMPLATAVHKMTGLPAKRFGLSDRGVVRKGFAADLVIFDPDTVRDVATFEDPVQPSIGIDAVWVNGVLSYLDQESTRDRAGTFLSRSRSL